MLKASLISCWNEKQNLESYLLANKRSGFDFLPTVALTFLPTTTCLIKTVALLDVVWDKRNIGILKSSSARYVAKRETDEVTKSRVLN